MNVEATEHLRIRTHLHHALTKGELSLHFQPQFRLDSGTLTGAEALLRWRNPELGQVPPARFIPIAEDCGLISAIGEWVLGEACRQAARWRALSGTEISVAVNLSPVQFRRGDLAAQVARILTETSLKPDLLELEITESLLLQHNEIVLATVRELKALGVKLAIDDFGTGYSSLAYLKRFNVDTLKIDQSFVHDMVSDPVDAAIVHATIQMARSLNLATIAEGVETEQQSRFLSEHCCDSAQGYFYAKPMPADAFQAYLTSPSAGSGQVAPDSTGADS